MRSQKILVNEIWRNLPIYMRIVYVKKLVFWYNHINNKKNLRLSDVFRGWGVQGGQGGRERVHWEGMNMFALNYPTKVKNHTVLVAFIYMFSKNGIYIVIYEAFQNYLIKVWQVVVQFFGAEEQTLIWYDRT